VDKRQGRKVTRLYKLEPDAIGFDRLWRTQILVQFLKIHDLGVMFSRQGRRCGCEAHAREERIVDPPPLVAFWQLREQPGCLVLDELCHDGARYSIHTPFALAEQDRFFSPGECDDVHLDICPPMAADGLGHKRQTAGTGLGKSPFAAQVFERRRADKRA